MGSNSQSDKFQILKLSDEDYFDKVLGCWYGKNAGGTLGEPLEKLFGQDEMFDIDWYPKLPEGGIPNDDLEIQLVWLQALKERGLEISATDLADYWKKCIIYNYDEYGLHKTNLRKGLIPPVSGWYNNWFKDCMGCPIRSEIWACIAPGAPDIAARYAYEDAITDHAGGESVYGEIFNATLESMAFFLSERVQLVQQALKFIPENSKTARAINIALECYKKDIDWKEARNRILKELFSPIAQYSPINLGFQTIGLLYGQDFGDAICKAVNCGWDTDCTGATVGAIWGIIYGRKGLPDKWISVLGEDVVVNKAIQHLTTPTNLLALTKEVIEIGKQISERFKTGINLGINTESEITSENVLELFNSKITSIKSIINQDPSTNSIKNLEMGLNININYPEGPAILPNQPKIINLTIEKFESKNKNDISLKGDIKVTPPAGFKITSESEISWNLENKTINEIKLSFQADQDVILPSNSIKLDSLTSTGKNWIYNLILVGGFRWLHSKVYPMKNINDKLSPEKQKKQKMDLLEWSIIDMPENAIEIEPLFNNKPGIIYLKQYLYSPNKRKARIGVPTNGKMRLWINGKKLLTTRKLVPLRPNYGGEGANYVNYTLKSGWNSILIKLQRFDEPIKAHLVVAYKEWQKGMDDVIQSQIPFKIIKKV